MTESDAAQPAVEQRVQALLARMMLEQKIHMLHGHVPMAYTVPPIAEHGIPGLRMTDGPAGLNLGRGTPSTAMPMPIALAATWNPEAARMQGDVIAAELRANGMNVLLAPNADIVRQPWWGRAAEELGEDPWLISMLVVPFIQAVQRHSVLAYWDDVQHAWVAEAGAFEVLIGSSSRDIRARAWFQLTETTVFDGSARLSLEAMTRWQDEV